MMWIALLRSYLILEIPNYHFFFADVLIYERFDFADRLRNLEVRIIDVCNIVKLILRNYRL